MADNLEKTNQELLTAEQRVNKFTDALDKAVNKKDKLKELKDIFSSINNQFGDIGSTFKADKVESATNQLNSFIKAYKELYNQGKKDIWDSSSIEKFKGSLSDTINFLNNSLASGIRINVEVPKMQELPSELKQVEDRLNSLLGSLSTFGTLFNETHSDIAKNVITDKYEFDDLKKSINDTKSETSNLVDTLNKVKLGQLKLDDSSIQKLMESTDKLELKFKELRPETLDALQQVIDQINTEITDTADGADTLKANLNSMASSFKNSMDRIAINPDFSNIGKNFIDQVNLITERMRELTEYGKDRSDIEKALGFTIQEKDIQDALNRLQDEKREIQDSFNDFIDMNYNNNYFPGKSRDELVKIMKDQERKDYESGFSEQLPTEDQIKNIDNALKRLQGTIGKTVTGYIELYTEASRLNDVAELNKDLLTGYNFGELYGLDEKTATAADYNKIIADIARAEEEEERLEQKAKRVSEGIDLSTKSAEELSTKLQEIAHNDTYLSQEKKDQIINKDTIKSYESYKDSIDKANEALIRFSQTEVENKLPIKLDPNNLRDQQTMANYVQSIELARKELYNLTSSQKDFINDTKQLASEGKPIQTYILPKKEEIQKILDVLGNGLKVNLQAGSLDEKSFSTLKDDFNKYLAGFKGDIQVVSPDEYDKLIKIRDIQAAIDKEKRSQEDINKIIAEQEKLIERYNKAQLDIAKEKSVETKIGFINENKQYLSKSSLKELNALNEERKQAEHRRMVSDYGYDPYKTMQEVEAKFKKAKLELPVKLDTSGIEAELKGTSKKLYDEVLKNQQQEAAAKLKTEQQQIVNELNNSIRKKEITENKSLESSEKLRLYNDALSKLKKDTEEYLQVLEKKNRLLNLENSSVNAVISNRDKELTNIDTTGLDKVVQRISSVKNEINKAIRSEDIERVNSLTEVYLSLTDKILGKQRERQIAEQRIADELKRQQEYQQKVVSDLNKKVQRREIDEGTGPFQYTDAKKLEDYREALSKLTKGSDEYYQVLGKIKDIERDAFKNLAGGINIAIQSINSAMNQLIGFIRTVISLVNKVTNTLVKGFTLIKSGVTGIVSLFGNLGNRVSLFTTLPGQISLAATAINKLEQTVNSLKGAWDKAFSNQMVTKAKNLLGSVFSLKNIVGTQETQNVINWAQGMEQAFDISARDLIGDINELTGTMYGLGMSAKYVGESSESILMISRYLAFMGAAGGDTSTVMGKLVSGMKGMTASVDDLGLSVREAQMNTFLKDLKKQGGEFANISTDFSSLNEQARIYVRYASLIKQFTDKYQLNEFADALDTTTGVLSRLNQAWSSLQSTIGTGLAKIGAYLATFIIPVLKVINELVVSAFAWLSNLTGLDLSVDLTPTINNDNMVKDLADDASDLSDSLDDVADSSKKASEGLQSFDKVSNITTSDSSGSNSSMGDFDYSSLMDGVNEALKQLNEIMEQRMAEQAEDQRTWWDKLIDNAKQKTEEFEKWAAQRTGRINYDLGFDWDKIKKNLEKTKKNIDEFIKKWFKFSVDISLKFLDDINIGAIITEFTSLIEKITDVANRISGVLIPAFEAFYDKALAPIVQWLGGRIIQTMQFFEQELEKWAVWFEKNEKPIQDFFNNLADVVGVAWGIIQPYLDAAWDFLEEKLAKAAETARTKLEELMDAFSGGNKDEKIKWLTEELPGKLDKLAESMSTAFDSIISIGGTVVSIIGDLAVAFADFMVEDGLPWLSEKLKELADWMKENKEQIEEFLTKLANFSWETFKTFVDLVTKLIDWCVQHPDAVILVLEGIIATKIISGFAGLATSITTIATQLALIFGMQVPTWFAALTGNTALTVGAAATNGTLGAAGGAAASGGATAAGGAAAGGLAIPVMVIGIAASAVALFAESVGNLWNLTFGEDGVFTEEGRKNFKEKSDESWNNYQNWKNNTKISSDQRKSNELTNSRLSQDITNLTKVDSSKNLKNQANKSLKNIQSAAKNLSMNKGIDTSEIQEVIANYIKEVKNLSDDELKKRLPEMQAELSSMYGSIVDSFSEGIKVKELAAQGQEDIQNIVTNVIQPMNDMVKSIGEIDLSDASSSVKTNALQTVESLKTQYTQLLKSIEDGTYEGIENSSPEARQAIIDSINTTLEQLGIIYDTVYEATDETIMDNLPILQSTVEDAINASSTSLSNQTKTYKDIIDTKVEDITPEMSKQIEDNLNETKDSIHRYTQNIRDRFTEIVNDANLTVEEKSQMLSELMNETMVNPMDNLDEKVTAIMERSDLTYSEKSEMLDTLFNSTIITPLDELDEKINKVAEDSSLTYSERSEKIDTLLNQTLVEPLDQLETDTNSAVEESKRTLDTKVDSSITSASDSMGDMVEGFSSDVDSSITKESPSLLSKISTAFSNAAKSIGDWISDLLSGGNKKDYYTPGTVDIGPTNTGKVRSITNTSAQAVTAYASGGSPMGGQLFIANENGNPELVGKMPGARTGVVNNEMITAALKSAIFEGTYNANAEIYSQTGGLTGEQKVEINLEGIGLVTDSSIRELADKLTPQILYNISKLQGI